MQPQESDVETTDGFYAVFGRYDIKDDGKTVFLLDDSGTRFVRAAAGSWVAHGRGYLVYTGTTFHSVRLIENELPAGAEGIETRMGGCLCRFMERMARGERFVPVDIFRRNGLKACISLRSEKMIKK